MDENTKNQNIWKITIEPFLLNLISKFNENSFLTIVLRGKKIPFSILYISSIFSSLILNFFFILLGLSFRYFIKTEIINKFFLVIVFLLYGFLALIQACRVFSKKGEEDNKIMDYIINSSDDDDSERPKININSDKNEVEIELDTIKLDEIDDDRKNNNFIYLRKKKEMNNNNKLLNTGSFCNSFLGCLKMIISTEIGEKMQIFNMGLSTKLIDLKYLIAGNIFGIIIINAANILFGMEILQKRINNLFHFLEAVFYLSFAFHYIYSIYF